MMSLSEEILHLSDSNFDSAVKSSGSLLIDCWAAWCAPCKMIAPTIEALAKDYKGKVTFAKLDTDEAPKTAMALGIRSIPTLLFFKDGRQVDRLIGAHPRVNIEAAIKKHFV
ncbi:MAG: thioredoxin [Candidatus Thermoplasmatota archaeon]|nr:thioredoxin [Candidatus Thermoplasmatota archaeon]